MPRLLNVNSYHYRRGGADAVYLDHAELMAALGWDNAFFAMRHPKNLNSIWAKYFIDELEFGGDYTLSEKLKMAAKVVYSLEAQRNIGRLISDFRPQIAHLHNIYHHLSPSILPTLRDAGIPVVMTAHDLKIACPAYKMLNQSGICERCNGGSVLNVVVHRCVRDSLSASIVVAAETVVHRALKTYHRYLSQIVVPSHFFLEKFVEWGWPRDKFRYIPNYVDSTKFEANFRPGDYFFYFGRLAPEKGVATLLRAAHAAGAHLKIAGIGPQDAVLRSLAASLGVSVDFLGFRSGSELHELIRGARAVVLPSEWYENAPMSILESFALGKPVIGADIGGIGEMVRDSETGWLFPSGDVPQLTDLLRRVLAMPDSHVTAAGAAGRDHAVKNFSQKSYVDAMLQLYADLGVAA